MRAGAMTINPGTRCLNGGCPCPCHSQRQKIRSDEIDREVLVRSFDNHSAQIAALIQERDALRADLRACAEAAQAFLNASSALRIEGGVITSDKAEAKKVLEAALARPGVQEART